MARAKRTDRTEARRRHRAELAALTTEPDADIAGPAPTGKSAGEGAPPGVPASGPPSAGRTTRSICAATSRALPKVAHPLGLPRCHGHHPRRRPPCSSSPTPDAMAAIPGRHRHSRPAREGGRSQHDPLLPGHDGTAATAAIGAFLIGFTAKRASWLGGLIYGIFVTIVAIVILQTQAGRLLTGDTSAQAVIVGHAAWSPLGAALFASAAAWYRRFLDLANPNRQAQQQARKGKQKPAR